MFLKPFFKKFIEFQPIVVSVDQCHLPFQVVYEIKTGSTLTF